jgi:hypothetical protein
MPVPSSRTGTARAELFASCAAECTFAMLAGMPGSGTRYEPD